MVPGKVVLSTLSAGILLLALLPQATPAQAATFTVTTTQDAPHLAPLDGTCRSTLPGNPCTLRAAVQAVNFLAQTGAPHTINLGIAGTYTLAVQGAGEEAAATGDLDINNTQVAIANTSGAAAVLDGARADRVFDVGPLAPAQVTITGVTIQNGAAGTSPTAPTDVGGGIRVSQSSNLTLNNVTLTNNTAGNRGGAVGFSLLPQDPARRGTLTLTNSTISNNTAGQEAGGLFNNFTATLTNVTVRDNQVTGTVGSGVGGGIANAGTLTVTDSTVSGNTTRIAGGGIATTPPSMTTMTNSTLSGNRATVGGGMAGMGTLTLSRLTVRENTASLGAGGIASSLSATMTDLIIRDNTAAVFDGGIAAGGLLTITNAFITGNRAGVTNGGLGNVGNATLTNVTVSNNESPRIGGIGSGNTITLVNVTISGNAAVGPDAVAGGLGNGARATLTNVTISGNAAARGGGINSSVDVQAVERSIEPQLRMLEPTIVIPTEPPVLTLKNTIVSDSRSSGNCVGLLSSQGFNISSDNTCNLTGPSDRNNTNPLLGPLAENGGFAPTQALLAGSPAIDAASPDCPPPPTDQRGVTRPQGPRCDIGAFEAPAGTPGAPSPTPTATPLRVVPATATPTTVPIPNNVAQIIASLRPDGQPGVPAASRVGEVAQIQGGVTGTARVIGSMAVNVTVPPGVIPAGAAANVFFSTTTGIEAIGCPAAVVGTPTTCVGTLVGNALQGSTVRVFAGGVQVATGTVRGPGPAPNLPPPPPIVLPPPPAPQLVPLFPPSPPPEMVVAAEPAAPASLPAAPPPPTATPTVVPTAGRTATPIATPLTIPTPGAMESPPVAASEQPVVEPPVAAPPEAAGPSALSPSEASADQALPELAAP